MRGSYTLPSGSGSGAGFGAVDNMGWTMRRNARMTAVLMARHGGTSRRTAVLTGMVLLLGMLAAPAGAGMATASGVVALAPAVAAAAPLPSDPPPDADPNTPGVQLKIPYYAEPEFLLLNNNERWDIRNRPAGTVAAGYGHEPDAVDDALMASGRYAPVHLRCRLRGARSARRRVPRSHGGP